MQRIHSNEGWYIARAEEEAEWVGTLQTMSNPVGPGTRGGRAFVLETDGEHVPLYTANSERLLEPFAGKRVVVTGKLVDLRDEGFDRELRVAYIRLS